MNTVIFEMTPQVTGMPWYETVTLFTWIALLLAVMCFNMNRSIKSVKRHKQNASSWNSQASNFLTQTPLTTLRQQHNLQSYPQGYYEKNIEQKDIPLSETTVNFRSFVRTKVKNYAQTEYSKLVPIMEDLYLISVRIDKVIEDKNILTQEEEYHFRQIGTSYLKDTINAFQESLQLEENLVELKKQLLFLLEKQNEILGIYIARKKVDGAGKQDLNKRFLETAFDTKMKEVSEYAVSDYAQSDIDIREHLL